MIDFAKVGGREFSWGDGESAWNFGWVAPSKRTNAQIDAHEAAVQAMPTFAIQGTVDLPKGIKVVMTDFWKSQRTIADIGFAFTGYRQLTGSCVGVSEGNAVFTLAAIQRTLAKNPTKLFVPWWPFAYGRTRLAEGDRGEGEGALCSVMAETLVKEGVFGIDEIPDEPPYDRSDGLALTSRQEYTYSNGAYDGNAKYVGLGKTHMLGAAAPLRSTEEMWQAIANGYPVYDGCDEFIGNGSLNGDVALGRYDGRGGHATCYLGIMEHSTHGRLFLYSNQWDGNTYPEDGSGKGRCCVWVKEKDVANLFRLGGEGETFCFSHLNYFPAQPEVFSWGGGDEK